LKDNNCKHFWSLVFTLAERDIRVKYAQTFFGLTWMIVQPIISYFMISFFFGKLLRVNQQITDYSLFAYFGMMAWYYFSYIVGYSGISLLQNQDIVQKTNIPKLVLPFSKAFSGLFEFIIWLTVGILIFFIKGNHPDFKFILIPFLIIFNMIAGLSIGLWLSAITIKYRDIYHFIPYVIGISIFITPVLYPVTMVPENIKFIIYLNPMAGIIEGYRFLILNYEMPTYKYLYGLVALLIFFLIGIYYFKRTEKKMADLI